MGEPETQGFGASGGQFSVSPEAGSNDKSVVNGDPGNHLVARVEFEGRVAAATTAEQLFMDRELEGSRQCSDGFRRGDDRQRPLFLDVPMAGSPRTDLDPVRTPEGDPPGVFRPGVPLAGGRGASGLGSRGGASARAEHQKQTGSSPKAPAKPARPIHVREKSSTSVALERSKLVGPLTLSRR